jgi:selT/selW/selH-like putative selenoprotein
VADELLIHFEQVIQALTLGPSRDGRFEVTVDGELIFSKAALHRHAYKGEVVELVRPLAAAAEQAVRQGL